MKKQQDQNIGSNLPIVVCECGARIILLPDLDEMARVLDEHAATHEKSISDPNEAEAEHCRIEELLIQKVFSLIERMPPDKKK